MTGRGFIRYYSIHLLIKIQREKQRGKQINKTNIYGTVLFLFEDYLNDKI